MNNYEYDVQWANPALNINGSTDKQKINATTDVSAIMALMAKYKLPKLK